MLILSRRINESIHIGDDVVMTILGIKGHQVRVAFSAPPHVKIHREEVVLKIAQEKAEAKKAEKTEAA